MPRFFFPFHRITLFPRAVHFRNVLGRLAPSFFLRELWSYSEIMDHLFFSLFAFPAIKFSNIIASHIAFLSFWMVNTPSTINRCTKACVCETKSYSRSNFPQLSVSSLSILVFLFGLNYFQHLFFTREVIIRRNVCCELLWGESSSPGTRNSSLFTKL